MWWSSMIYLGQKFFFEKIKTMAFLSPKTNLRWFNLNQICRNVPFFWSNLYLYIYLSFLQFDIPYISSIWSSVKIISPNTKFPSLFGRIPITHLPCRFHLSLPQSEFLRHISPWSHPSLRQMQCLKGYNFVFICSNNCDLAWPHSSL